MTVKLQAMVKVERTGIVDLELNDTGDPETRSCNVHLITAPFKQVEAWFRAAPGQGDVELLPSYLDKIRVQAGLILIKKVSEQAPQLDLFPKSTEGVN